MEVYSKTTRFTLACNNSDQIIGVFVCQCVCYLYVDYVCCVEAGYIASVSNSAVICYW